MNKICVICGKEFQSNRKQTTTCSRICARKLASQRMTKTKTCALCGKTFITEHDRQIYCKDDHYRPCPVCGKPVKIHMDDVSAARTCSSECKQKLTERTNMDKYGFRSPHMRPESRAIFKQISNSEENKAKREATCLAKFGVKNVSQADSVRKKISETISSEEFQSKLRSINRSKYGVDYAMQSQICRDRFSQSVQEKYGVPWYCMTDECKNAQGNIISSTNRAFKEKLSLYGIETSPEFRINSRSYDLHVINSNVLIEINPSFTHSAVPTAMFPSLPPEYHKVKTDTATAAGYRCINIWDWDDIRKIICLLSPKRVVYARTLEVKPVNAKECNDFLALHHLQGSVKGQSVMLGLYSNQELIELMTFGKPRYNSNYQYELIRLCTHSDFRVVGGASKLWHHFIDEVDPESVISYCDRSKFTGSVYAQLGMKLLRTVEPAKVWSKGNKYITDNLLRQKGYDQLFGASFGKGVSNEQLMLDNGWLPVYDCGQDVYEYRK